MRETLTKTREIAAPSCYKFLKTLKLRDSYRCLQVRHFQIIAEMSIDIFVIVALWQVAQFPVEPLVAGVVLSRPTITVATPVTERLHNFIQVIVIGEDCPALARRDVMRGIETQCSDVAKCADMLTADSGAQRVATIFDQEQSIRSQIARIASTSNGLPSV